MSNELITEEALRENFKLWDDHKETTRSFLEIEISRGDKYLTIEFFNGVLSSVYSWSSDDEIHFPGCKTMQDLNDLIRLLGGKVE